MLGEYFIHPTAVKSPVDDEEDSEELDAEETDDTEDGVLTEELESELDELDVCGLELLEEEFLELVDEELEFLELEDFDDPLV